MCVCGGGRQQRRGEELLKRLVHRQAHENNTFVKKSSEKRNTQPAAGEPSQKKGERLRVHDAALLPSGNVRTRGCGNTLHWYMRTSGSAIRNGTPARIRAASSPQERVRKDTVIGHTREREDMVHPQRMGSHMRCNPAYPRPVAPPPPSSPLLNTRDHKKKRDVPSGIEATGHLSGVRRPGKVDGLPSDAALRGGRRP